MKQLFLTLFVFVIAVDGYAQQVVFSKAQLNKNKFAISGVKNRHFDTLMFNINTSIKTTAYTLYDEFAFSCKIKFEKESLNINTRQIIFQRNKQKQVIQLGVENKKVFLQINDHITYAKDSLLADSLYHIVVNFSHCDVELWLGCHFGFREAYEQYKLETLDKYKQEEIVLGNHTLLAELHDFNFYTTPISGANIQSFCQNDTLHFPLMKEQEAHTTSKKVLDKHINIETSIHIPPINIPDIELVVALGKDAEPDKERGDKVDIYFQDSLLKAGYLMDSHDKIKPSRLHLKPGKNRVIITNLQERDTLNQNGISLQLRIRPDFDKNKNREKENFKSYPLTFLSKKTAEAIIYYQPKEKLKIIPANDDTYQVQQKPQKPLALNILGKQQRGFHILNNDSSFNLSGAFTVVLKVFPEDSISRQSILYQEIESGGFFDFGIHKGKAFFEYKDPIGNTNRYTHPEDLKMLQHNEIIYTYKCGKLYISIDCLNKRLMTKRDLFIRSSSKLQHNLYIGIDQHYQYPFKGLITACKVFNKSISYTNCFPEELKDPDFFSRKEIQKNQVKTQYEDFPVSTYFLKDTVYINKKEIELLVYDNQQIDGDIISLAVNRKMILHHHKLTKKPKVLRVALTDKENVFVVRASSHSEGQISPNTAMLDIKYDDVVKTVSLVSDEMLNGGVIIKYDANKQSFNEMNKDKCGFICWLKKIFSKKEKKREKSNKEINE